MVLPEYVFAEGVAFAFGVAVVVLAFKKLPTAALVAAVLLVVSSVVVADTVVLPRLDVRISARPLARKLKEADPSLGNIATFKLSRNWQYGMNFYFNRQLPEWTGSSGEPQWILSGTMLDQQILDRYKMDLEDAIPGNRDVVLVFHRF